MTKREAIRQTHQENTLLSLGFTRKDAESLRRISNQLHRWYELECGVDAGGVERDEQTGKVTWYSSRTGERSPYPDRETGAVKRLQGIIAARNNRVSDAPVSYYLQGDPRGAALYIIRAGDVPEGADVSAYYTRGIVVY